jgi:hypothetical protein
MRNVSVADWLRTRVGDGHVLPVVHAFVRLTCCDDSGRQSAGAANEVASGPAAARRAAQRFSLGSDHHGAH